MVLVTPWPSRCALLAIVITWAFGLPTANAQTFDSSDGDRAGASEGTGRHGFALLKGVDFQDGTFSSESTPLSRTIWPSRSAQRRQDHLAITSLKELAYARAEILNRRKCQILARR